jgi:hypothetical protein
MSTREGNTMSDTPIHDAVVASTEPTVTVVTGVDEIWYKGQRVIRTVLVSAIVWVPGLIATLPLVAAAFNSPDIPPKVYLVVTGIVAGALVILGVLSRVMSIPAVNAWLTKLGAGSVPRSATVVTVPVSQVADVAKLN